MINITDCHSHFGNDNFWPNSGMVDNYIKNALKIGISEVYGMSVACPSFIEENKKIVLLVHKFENGKFNHYKVIVQDGKVMEIPIFKHDNPYKRANDYIYNLVNITKDMRINYVPLVHPYYYSYEDLLEHKKRGAKMFKIHGIAGGVIPKLIDEEFFKILENLKIPILIHTDYSEKENLLSYNSAINWLQVLGKYNIKVYLAHAARLSEYAIDIINKDDRYMIGIGPDRYLFANKQMEKNPNDYLEYCFAKFNMDKILFDIDYPWNINSTKDYNLDWDGVSRIQEKLTESEQEKIFSINIKKLIK